MTLQPDRFETGQPMHLAGLDISYTFKTMNDIPEQWDRVQPFLGATPNQIGREAFGVCHAMRQDGFRYFSGVHISNTSNVPQELTTLEIPAQKYAVFKHRGPISAIRETIDGAWQWLKASGQAVLDHPMHVEVYGEDWSPDKDGGVELWTPVR